MARTTLSNEALDLIAARFKVLAEPLRLRILHMLQDGEKSVNELIGSSRSKSAECFQTFENFAGRGHFESSAERQRGFYSIADESIFELCEVVCNSLEKRLENQARIFALTLKELEVKKNYVGMHCFNIE